MARKKPLSIKESKECRERLQFLETAWQCRTDYSIDLSTGRGELRITLENSGVALFLGDVDFRSIGLPSAETRHPRP